MMIETSILFAETDESIRRCFPAMQELRPHLAADGFVERVRRQQAQGYRLVFLQEHEQVHSVAGFRILEFLAWGKVFYIDDLATLAEQQQRGYGSTLLSWLIQHARTHSCDELHLDSGYQRHAAHRLYLKSGLQLGCHHFALRLK